MRPLRFSVLLAAVLAACYPDLDWREVRSEAGGFVVLLPAKPRIEELPLSQAASRPVLHQLSARARNTAFAAGFSMADSTGHDIGTELRDALLRNIGGRVTSETRIESGGLQGRETLAEGQAGQKAFRLRLRTFQSDGRFYQLAVLGPPDDFQASEIDTFFLSFKPDASAAPARKAPPG